jgi:Polyketide cyclase / dehydrase and lipid transport
VSAAGLFRISPIAAAALVGLGLAATLIDARSAAPAAEQPISIQNDLRRREPAIHWPAGFEPETAELFAHNELLINAGCEAVWSRIADAVQWPAWYPNARAVQLLGGDARLRDGSVFRWSTFGLSIESRVHEYLPSRRLGWYGYAPGTAPSFYHTWYLQPQGALCRVVTEEVGVGKDAAAFRRNDETLLHRGHDLWLAGLKWAAEGK